MSPRKPVHGMGRTFFGASGTRIQDAANTATLTDGNLRIPLTLVDDKRVEPSDAGGVVATFPAVKFRPAGGHPDGSGDRHHGQHPENHVLEKHLAHVLRPGV